MSNITYLLGAGASRGCLPVVAEMQEQIQKTHGWMANYIEYNNKALLNSPLKHLNFSQIYDDLKWLGDLCNPKKNFSIDTYAKKLKVSGASKEYERLKNALTMYFTLQQKKELPDVRYDNFWASLLDKNNNFPSNIRILSWNYDFQPELTYQDFINGGTLSESASGLKVLSHSSNNLDFHNPSEFKLFKLNGSATYYSEAQRDSTNYLVNEFKNEDLLTFFDKIHAWYAMTERSTIKYENNLTYAWEHQFGTPFYNFLKDSIKETTILVVIGYSFPFFNREVDKKVFGEFMPNLDKVYFQAPKDDVNNLPERFKSIRIVREMVTVEDVYQFTFPNEM